LSEAFHQRENFFPHIEELGSERFESMRIGRFFVVNFSAAAMLTGR